jgi:hypothetical protein
MDLYLFAWHDQPEGGARDFRGIMTTEEASRLVLRQGYKHAHLAKRLEGVFDDPPRLIIVGWLEEVDLPHVGHKRYWNFSSITEIVELVDDEGE